MRNLLATAMTLGFALGVSTIPAAACGWNKTAESKQTVAEVKVEKPQSAVTTFEPGAKLKLDTKVEDKK